MKKRAKITPFAKIVIAGLIFLGVRYLYLNKESLISGELFNFSDTVKVDNIKTDTIVDADTFKINQDTLKIISKDSNEFSADTFTINVERAEDLFIIKSSDFSINILLNDSVSVSDTIFFNVSEDKKVTGRIIIK